MTTADIARPRVRPGARMTLDDFIALLPDMEQRCELHAGVLYLTPEATVDHQFLTQLLWKYLFDGLTASGIAEYWILDGDADTVTVLALGPDGRYRNPAEEQETIP